MPWVPWIHVEADDTLTQAAKELYKKTRNPLTRKLSDLTRLTSSTPVVAELLDTLCKAVYGGDNGLTVREKEIAALITSSLNGCVH
jgi:hypothetical protein